MSKPKKIVVAITKQVLAKIAFFLIWKQWNYIELVKIMCLMLSHYSHMQQYASSKLCYWAMSFALDKPSFQLNKQMTAILHIMNDKNPQWCVDKW